MTIEKQVCMLYTNKVFHDFQEQLKGLLHGVQTDENPQPSSMVYFVFNKSMNVFLRFIFIDYFFMTSI